MIMTWSKRAAAFHVRRRKMFRPVFVINGSRICMTTEMFLTTAGFFGVGIMGAGSGLVSHWGVLITGLFGYAAGKFVFPIPDVSVASSRGPRRVESKNAAELDAMTPEEIRIYANNLALLHGSGTGWWEREALNRQRRRVKQVADQTGTPRRFLMGASTSSLDTFRNSHGQHQILKARWVRYEIDPELQMKAPAMSDLRVPATAQMIRAMKHAELAATIHDPQGYAAAVENFAQALAIAEQSAVEAGM
ncbi:hypothetical protein V3C33_20635 (plasmid) [Micrococcaceae bacterium Sec5.7]